MRWMLFALALVCASADAGGWVVVNNAGNYESQWTDKDYGKNGRDVLLVVSGNGPFDDGRIVSVKPAGSNWSELEKGVGTAEVTNVKFLVVTITLSEAVITDIEKWAIDFKFNDLGDLTDLTVDKIELNVIRVTL